MRVHTRLTESEMWDALRECGAPVSFHVCQEHSSRTSAHAFEVRLEGSGGRTNTGHYGAGDFNGATWDEWGAFMGRVYDLDPSACWGGTAKSPAYANASDFHYKTGRRFERHNGSNLPDDTHPRHRWVYQGSWGDHGTSDYQCSKCHATRPGWAA